MTIKKDNNILFQLYTRYPFLVFFFILISNVSSAQIRDSSEIILKNVMIENKVQPEVYKSTIPSQILSGRLLQQLSTTSISDAARYFSGVLIKDYGGVGGLKTISVRSLGASNTGILYDGLPVSNTQTGQIDFEIIMPICKSLKSWQFIIK